jgi:hypothetical protein
MTELTVNDVKYREAYNGGWEYYDVNMARWEQDDALEEDQPATHMLDRLAKAEEVLRWYAKKRNHGVVAHPHLLGSDAGDQAREYFEEQTP